ncbi:MAG: hypothetical protein MZV63_18010 [Marinilabiliales bacterium]|nr:hypothetical protein [Marinilabiliales bacterium]
MTARTAPRRAACAVPDRRRRGRPVPGRPRAAHPVGRAGGAAGGRHATTGGPRRERWPRAPGTPWRRRRPPGRARSASARSCWRWRPARRRPTSPGPVMASRRGHPGSSSSPARRRRGEAGDAREDQRRMRTLACRPAIRTASSRPRRRAAGSASARASRRARGSCARRASSSRASRSRPGPASRRARRRCGAASTR